MSFHPEGDHPNDNDLHLLYGVLPHEVVCTENLTPFLKLLPCKGKAGIASLLDGHKLFDASWQTMAIDVRPICSPGNECVLQIEQTIDMVLDIERSKRPRGKPALQAWPPPNRFLFSTNKCFKTILFPDRPRLISCLATLRSPTTLMTHVFLWTTPARGGLSPRSSASL